jgi:2-oxoglutarate ferredoxin oxidoreductase subunit gamma
VKYNILIAGFGGQGVMLVGQMLGYAACDIGKKATFFPSYGPEQRGGAASCSVVISDEEIGSPVVLSPNVLVCFNRTALDKYLSELRPKGLLIVNSSSTDCETITRDDIEVLEVPADDLALEMGNAKVANVIMFGAIVCKTGVLSLEGAKDVVLKKLAKKPQLQELNNRAFDCGVAQVRFE